MPRVHERYTNTRYDVERSMVGNGAHELYRPRAVPQGVERLDWLLPSTGQKLGVLILDVRGVGQHDGAKVPRRWGAPDCALVSVPDEKWKTACVVNVRM